ncbi:MAG: choice-of-anchor U domain-containing protein [Chromatocurvus sp.]
MANRRKKKFWVAPELKRPWLWAALLCLTSLSLSAAEYDINWSGTDGYTMTGSFSFSDSLLGTGPITGDDIDSLIIEVFQNGNSQGTWSLFDDGFENPDAEAEFNFNFDTTSESFSGEVNANQSSPDGQIWNTEGNGTGCTPVGFIKASFAQAVCANGSLVGLLSTLGTEAADSPLIATRSDGGGGGGGGGGEPALFDIGGTISGLTAGNTVNVTVQEVGQPGVEQTGLTDGAFNFAAILADSEDFEVTLAPPNDQVCTLENGTGTISGADVDDVAISCVARTISLLATGPGGSATVDLVTDNGASAGCSLDAAAVIAAPPGIPSGFELPFGAVDFSATGCSGDNVTVEVTFGEDISDATYFKFINNAWQELPGVAITGNTARFTIADNGPFDADPTAGIIRDPSGPGVPTGAGTGPGDTDPDPDADPDTDAPAEPIPTLGATLLGVLAMLLAIAGLRRRRAMSRR